ncbi:DUF4113 domain-containing protein [Ferrovibrio sp.]|uniref:DUF4113 domain-containing protein n=1 Tax=Ferrovibrio sp. TaxID=1917215 RepID=UPI0025BE0DD0|nr:DUF4113 domain-containing protein [Ferrovibrio sp.]
MAGVDVGEVWGIGGRSAAKLQALGVKTVAQLAALDPRQARSLLTVVGERIVHELNGRPCLQIEELTPARKTTAVTRSFAAPVKNLDALCEAIASFATRAAEKLREHDQEAGLLQVFFHSSPFRAREGKEPWFSRAASHTFAAPTSDTLQLVSAAVQIARRGFQPGCRLTKAGVMALGLVPAGSGMRDLFEASAATRPRLMAAIDAINARQGRDVIRTAAAGIQKASADRTRADWRMRQARLSPSYTTRLSDILEVRC